MLDGMACTNPKVNVRELEDPFSFWSGTIPAAACLVVTVVLALSLKSWRRKSAPVGFSYERKTERRPRWWRGNGTAMLVDANNVRGALRFEVDVVDFCGACCRAARRCESVSEMIICVDHGPETCAMDCGGICVAFAGKKTGRYATADDMIVSAAGRIAKLGGRIVVITADRELSRRCRYACLRFPEACLRVVRSNDFADWLDAIDALRPTSDDSWHAFGRQVSDWIVEPLVAKSRKRIRTKPRRPGKNSTESTPSRVDQASGLFHRLVTWRAANSPARCGQHMAMPTSDEQLTPEPRWYHDFLDRHPWPSKHTLACHS